MKQLLARPWGYNSFVIRQTEQKDFEDIVLLSQNEEEDSPPREVLGPLIWNYPSFVRQEDGKTVGFWVTESLGDDILLVRDFAVSRAERYHQYGRELMEQLCRVARREGYKALLLSLRHSRPASEDFLLRSGWSLLYETGDTRLFSRSLLL